jgi:hypothetical protein
VNVDLTVQGNAVVLNYFLITFIVVTLVQEILLLILHRNSPTRTGKKLVLAMLFTIGNIPSFSIPLNKKTDEILFDQKKFNDQKE